MRRVVLFNFIVVATALGIETPKALPPLTLATVMQKTLEHHPGIREAKSRLDQRDARLGMAWADVFPKLAIEAEVGTFHDRIPNPGETEIPTVGRDRNRYVGNLVLRQALFQGFGSWNGVESSSLDRQIEQAKLEVATADALKETLKLYFEIQSNEQELGARREAKSFHEREWNEAKLRKEQGRGTEMEVLQGEYSAISEDARIQELKGEIDSGHLQLSQKLGLTSSADYRLSDSLEKAMAMLEEGQLPTLQSASELLADKNPKLRQARLKVDKMKAETNKALSSGLPSLDLVLSVGTNAYLQREIATGDTLSYSGEIQLKIPLFSGLSDIHHRRAARSMISETEIAFEKERQDVLDDLLKSYRKWNVASLRILASTKKVLYQEELLKRNEQLFREGRATATTVRQAFADLLDAKKTQGEAIIEKITAVIDIRGILGWFERKT